MTGPWLIVKWACLAGVALYLLLTIACWRLRPRRSQLRSRLFRWLAVIFNFVALGVPMLFENVPLTRACFVIAAAICLGGIVILMRDLARQDQTAVADKSADEQDIGIGQIQTLKLS